jgi:hypothetical protein
MQEIVKNYVLGGIPVAKTGYSQNIGRENWVRLTLKGTARHSSVDGSSGAQIQ